MTDRAMPPAGGLAQPRGRLTPLSIAAMLLLALVWGLSIPATKLGLLTVPPLTLTALRFLVAVPLLMILAVGRLRVPWRAAPSIAVYLGSAVTVAGLLLWLQLLRTVPARIAASGMNLTFGTRPMSTSRPNVKFGNSTRIINILVVLLFPTFALGADTKGMQMLETNH